MGKGDDVLIRITLNGECREMSDNVSIDQLLILHEINREHVAVELNMTILRKTGFSETILQDGDVVEVVNFVGGGEI